MGQQPQQGPQINEMALIQAVLGGHISTTEASWLMEMLGGEADEGKEILKTSIDELERLYAPGTEDSLSRGKYSTGPGGLLSGAGTLAKKGFSQDYSDRLNSYNQQRALAVGIINKAREAGVLNEGEYETMIQNMPNEWTSEKVASEWFTNTRRLLQNSSGGTGESSPEGSAVYNMMPWLPEKL